MPYPQFKLLWFQIGSSSYAAPAHYFSSITPVHALPHDAHVYEAYKLLLVDRTSQRIKKSKQFAKIPTLGGNLIWVGLGDRVELLTCPKEQLLALPPWVAANTPSYLLPACLLDAQPFTHQITWLIDIKNLANLLLSSA